MWRNFRAGCPQTGAERVGAYHQTVYRFLAHLTWGVRQAEGLIQETFDARPARKMKKLVRFHRGGRRTPRRHDSLVHREEGSIMGDILTRLDGGEILGMLTIGGGLLVAAISVIAGCWYHARKLEIEANLKQQMLTRGMSATEIEQVLKASPTTVTPEQVVFTGNAVTDKATLVKLMMAAEMDGKDIARVLEAFGSPERGNEPPQVIQQMRQKAELVGNLIQQAMEAADIEKVVRAFHADRAHNKERVVKD
jgi:hypothetical protein